MRFFRVVPLVLLLLGSAPLPGATLDEILDRKVLFVGLTGEQPPFSMKNLRGQLMGADIDIAKALAELMEVEVEFVQLPFGELLPALSGRKVDIVLSGVTITANRSRDFTFVGPYFLSGKTLLAKKSSRDLIESGAVLNNPKLTISYLAGSTSEDFVKRQAPEAQHFPAETYDAAVQALIDDKATLMIADMPVCIVNAMRYPEERLQVHPNPFTIEPLGVVLTQEDPKLARLLDQYILALDRSGFFAEVERRWLRDPTWIADLP